jgi:hypothetical protein
MFSPYTRYALMLLTSAGAVYLFVMGEPIAGGAFVLATWVTVYFHVRYASVLTAFGYLMRGDMATGQRLLKMTPKPEFLAPLSRGFYHFGNGIIALREDDPNRAEEELTRAMNFRIGSPHNKAMLNVLLAGVHLELHHADQARRSLDEAERLEHNEDLDAQIAKLRRRLELSS